MIFNLNEYSSLQDLIKQNIEEVRREDMCVIMDQAIHLDSPSQKIAYMEGNFVGLMCAYNMSRNIIVVKSNEIEEYDWEGQYTGSKPATKESVPENIRRFMTETVIPKMIKETKEIIEKMEKGIEEEGEYVGMIFVKDKEDLSKCIDFLIGINRGDEGPERRNTFDGKPILAFNKDDRSLMGMFLIVKGYLVIMEAGELGTILNKEGVQVKFNTFLQDMMEEEV